MRLAAIPLLLILGGLLAGSLSAQSDFYDETVLRTIELNFQQSNWWTLLLNNYASETDIAADLTVDGVVYPSVGVRFKGNSSYQSIGSSQKKPFKITTDSFVLGQEVLGYDKITLNNAFKDPTFVREVLSYRIMRDYLPAPKANFVKLMINGQNWGVYVNVQQVDKKLLGSWLEDADGSRYKAGAAFLPPPAPPPPPATLTWLGTTPASYQQAYELKSDVDPNSWLDLINLCNVLNNTPANQLDAALQPIFSVDRSLWFNALNNIMSNLDSYLGRGANYYVYHEPTHDRMHVIPWDLNESFGVFMQGFNYQTIKTLSPSYQSTNTARPLMQRLFLLPQVPETYYAHMRTILADWFDWSIIGPLVAQYQALIAAEVQADTKKLYSYSLFSQGVTQDITIGGGPGGGTIPGLQPFVTTKRNYLLGHVDVTRPAPAITAVSHLPASPTASGSVTVTATVAGPQAPVGSVDLLYRALGAFVVTPMFDDGQHGDGGAGDGVWGATIPAQSPGFTVEYYVRAASQMASGGGMAFSPKAAEHLPHSYVVQPGPTPQSTVKINEFVAKNNNGIQDPAGQYEDWIELVNPTGAAIDVSGMYLTDQLTDPTQWTIPAGTVLQPGQVLLIWADDDPLEGPLHATFKLSASGEEIALIDTDGTTLLDHVAFGPQESDISTGRFADGLAPFVTFLEPSPNVLNAPGTCGVRRFSALDSTAHDIDLSTSSDPTVGAAFSFDIANGPASTPHLMLISAWPAYTAIPGADFVLLLDVSFLPLFQDFTDAFGSSSRTYVLPNQPALAGLTAYTQAAAADGFGQLHVSNAIEMTICP